MKIRLCICFPRKAGKPHDFSNVSSSASGNVKRFILYGSRSFVVIVDGRSVDIGGIECDGSIVDSCLVENLDVNNVGDAVCEGIFEVGRVINVHEDVLNNEVILPLTARDKKMSAAAMMEVDEII